MTQQVSPFIEAKYGWAYGESGWNAGVDEDLLKFSFLFNGNVNGVVSSLPAAVDGEAYYLTTDSRLYFCVGTTWYSSPTPRWFQFRNKSTGVLYEYNGTFLSEIQTPTQLGGRITALETTVGSLGSAAFQDVSAFATQSALDVAVGQAQAYTDTLRSDLAATDGSSRVGFIQDGTGAVARTTQAKQREVVSVKDFGAVGDGIVDDTTAIQTAITSAKNLGKSLHIPSGYYKVTSTLLLDNSTSANYIDSKKINIYGDGINQTRIIYSGTGPALKIVGGINGTALSSQCFQSVSYIGFTGNSAAGTIGVLQDTCQHLRMVEVEIQQFEYGLQLVDCDFSSFHKIIIHWNKYGVFAQQRDPREIASTAPNGLDFVGCQIAGNSQYGAFFLKGSCINFYGGDVEGNGIGGTGTTYGLLFQDSGVQGGVGCNLNGVYFEQNKGAADVWILALNPPGSGLNPNHCVHSINSCSFNRVNDTNYTSNNIIVSVDTAVAGKQKVSIQNSSFKGYGTYVPDSGRKYVSYATDSMNASNFLMQGCLQQDDIESVMQLEYYNCALGISTAQSIPSGVLTAISFDVETFDRDNLHNSSSPTNITIPVTGVYQVSACARFVSNITGTRVLRIYRNGSIEVVSDSKIAVSGGNPTYLNASREVLLTKGDTISVQVFQDTGSSLDLSEISTYFSLRSVAP